MTDWRNQGWTPEKKAELKRLWLEDKSANEIGRTLFITRNAAIGQVRRMGLSKVGRAGVSAPGPKLRAPKVVSNARFYNGLSATMKVKKPVPVVHGDASKLNPEPVAPYRAKADTLTPTATIFTLSGHVCKWPIGDPSSEGFGFCGRRRERGSYCEHHARIGYTPPVKNRTGNELARSLRRYV